MEHQFNPRDKSLKLRFLNRANLLKILFYAQFTGVYVLNNLRNKLELSFLDVSKSELSISIFYINLDQRRDRYASITGELRRLQFTNAVRVSGFVRSPGGLGCSLSHKAALNLAKHGHAQVAVDQALADSLTLKGSVHARAHVGGTSPEQVKWAVAQAKLRLSI